MMIGPNSSGRTAASIITAQPAWQLPMTHGLPSASGCSAIPSRGRPPRRGRHPRWSVPARVRQEADEIAGMAGVHGDADFAVGFEAADPGP